MEPEQEWIKTIISQLSPRVGEYSADVLSKEVEPLIDRVLSRNSGGLPAHFHFEKIDLGSTPPKIRDIKAHKNQSDDDVRSIVIDFLVEYEGDCDIQVSLLGIHSGIRDLRLSGKGRLVLKPTTKNAFPFFVGGAQFCLLERPELDFDLDGIADVCDWPVLRRKVRKEILDDVDKNVVFPHKIVVPMSENVDPMTFKCFAPTGILSVKLLAASGLPRKGGLRSLVGQDKPDVMAKIVLGAIRYDTPVIKNTTEPSWEDDPQRCEFLLETLEGHRINVRLFDEDTFSRDEFLGEVFIDVGQHLEDKEQETLVVTETLQENLDKHTKYEISGDITISLRWIPFGSVPTYDGNTKAVLTVFVYSCNNLDSTDLPDLPCTKLRLTYGDSKVRESALKKNNQHPQFNEGFTYILTEGFEEGDDNPLIIEVHEVTGGISFGQVSLLPRDLIGEPYKRKILPLSEENPMLSITLSANVKTVASQ